MRQSLVIPVIMIVFSVVMFCLIYERNEAEEKLLVCERRPTAMTKTGHLDEAVREWERALSLASKCVSILDQCRRTCP
ncbi:MAG: hypothetical protein UY96_C0003G0047 [Parcubacteria group bacterium GW2011_GWB1_56_8]|nr:MAG: hypothetical protein UY96_C0003G0047 [Parcubacteria group bacterium GW2011_GWB1_56_8]